MKVFYKVALAIIMFSIMIAFSYWLFEPRGTTLEEWSITFGDVKEDFNPPKIIEVPESQVYTFKTNFYKTNKDSLVIPRINGHAFRVYINHQLVYEVGDLSEPTANIWNYVHMVSLSSVEQKDINEIQIDVFALHDTGMIKLPYLAEKASVQLYIEMQNFFASSTNYMVIGASFAFSILLFLFALRSETHKKVYFYYSIALALFSIYSTDLTFRETTGPLVTYLMIRKIQMISIIMAVTFMVFAVRKYFANKNTHPIVFVLIVLLLLPIAFAQDFVTLDRRVKTTNLLIPIGLIYIIIVNFKDRYKRNIFASVFISLTVFYMFIQFIFSVPSIFFIQYGVLVYLMGVAFVITADYTLLEQEKEKLASKSKIDKLTQVYNRYVLEELNFTNQDCLVFIDIDEFKAYNDTKGHTQGDQLLVNLVNIFSDNLGQHDKIVRYGGDEFIICFKNTTTIQATKRMEQIRATVKELYSEIDLSYGVTQYQANLLNTLIDADHKMYDMKRFKKEGKAEVI